MTSFFPLILYVIALFFIGLGNAIVTYHILRYRDPDDISGVALVIYHLILLVVVVGTAILLDWQSFLAS